MRLCFFLRAAPALRCFLLARRLANLLAEGEEIPPEGMPTFQAVPIRQPDAGSLYTPPRRRAPFTPSPVVAAVLDPSDVRALRAVTLEQLGLAITPTKIQRFVGQFFNGHKVLHVRDLPLDAFEQEEDLPWLIYTIAYGDDAEDDLMATLSNRTNGKKFVGSEEDIEDIYFLISSEF